MVPARQPRSAAEATSNWQEHIDGKPQYAPPIPPLAPAKFTGGLYVALGAKPLPECKSFATSLQKQHLGASSRLRRPRGRARRQACWATCSGLRSGRRPGVSGPCRPTPAKGAWASVPRPSTSRCRWGRCVRSDPVRVGASQFCDVRDRAVRPGGGSRCPWCPGSTAETSGTPTRRLDRSHRVRDNRASPVPHWRCDRRRSAQRAGGRVPLDGDRRPAAARGVAAHLRGPGAGPSRALRADRRAIGSGALASPAGPADAARPGATHLGGQRALRGRRAPAPCGARSARRRRPAARHGPVDHGRAARCGPADVGDVAGRRPVRWALGGHREGASRDGRRALGDRCCPVRPRPGADGHGAHGLRLPGQPRCAPRPPEEPSPCRVRHGCCPFPSA